MDVFQRLWHGSENILKNFSSVSIKFAIFVKFVENLCHFFTVFFLRVTKVFHELEDCSFMIVSTVRIKDLKSLMFAIFCVFSFFN